MGESINAFDFNCRSPGQVGSTDKAKTKVCIFNSVSCAKHARGMVGEGIVRKIFGETHDDL